MSAAVHALKALLVCAEDEVRQLEAFQCKVTVTQSNYLKNGGSLVSFGPSDSYPTCLPSQECLDSTFSWFGGLASFPLLPSAQEEEDEQDEEVPESMRETSKEKEEKKSDYDVARQDVVKVNKQSSFNTYFASFPLIFQI